MKAIKCTSCGANIVIDENQKNIICEYCNTPYSTESYTTNYGNNLNIQNATINVITQEKEKTKFCKLCGEKIPEDAIICKFCGRQIEEIKVTHVSNPNYNSQEYTHKMDELYNLSKKEINKWISLLLCVFLGFLGAHKFYEGKVIMGLVYLFTGGLFGIGWFIDIILILCKSNPYFV